MKQVCKIIFLILLFYTNVKAQSITWNRLYNGPSNFHDLGYDICQTTDGNFVIAGTTQNPIYSFYIIKINPYGDTIWTKIIGGYGTGQLAYTVAPSEYGGCVFTGDADTSFAIKLNSFGNVEWSNKYGGRHIQMYDIKRTLDNGYIACGIGIAFKIDMRGNLQWIKSYEYYLNSVEIAIDSGYILAGSGNIGGISNAIILKINSEGDFEWVKNYILENVTGAKAIRTLFNHYILAGATNGNGQVIKTYLMKTDSNGDSLFTKIISSDISEYINTFEIIDNRKLILTLDRALTPDLIFRAKVYITDLNGKILNEKIFEKGGQISFNSLVTISNGDMLFTGSSRPILSGGIDDVIGVRTDSLLNAPPVNINKENEFIENSFYLFQNYPNPFNSETKISIQLSKRGNVELTIFDVSGKKVETLINKELNAGYSELNWNGSKYPSGIYFISLNFLNQKIQIKKMIILK